jgi:SAM-dependent methyltransferase
MAHSLTQVSTVNRWLGGDWGLRWGVANLLANRSEMSILDVGSGDGTTLARLAGWVRRRGIQVRAVAVDLHAHSCAIARDKVGNWGGVEVIRSDARDLPFPESSFDVVISSLTLHHFDDEDAGTALREMSRVAEGRVVISDLRRSRLSYLGARALAATVWRGNPYTRHDGPVSVLRAFSPSEMKDLARRAGLESVALASGHPFRLTLVGTPRKTTP